MTFLYQYPDKTVSWNERDALLFANSIGCTPQELQYLYELHPSFTPFPTYPIVLTFKHDYTTTTSFRDHFTKHLTPPPNFTPGFPKLDIQKVVDGERTLEVLHKLPTSSNGRDFKIESRVIGVWDKGKGKSTIVQTEHLLVETAKSGTGIGGRKRQDVVTRMSETAVFMGQGGWGGPNGPSPSPSSSTPLSQPTATATHHIPLNAHLLYRLNGDYNPLHATQVEAAVIQPTPIMHGLYSWNVVARRVLSTFATGEASALKSFRAKFAAPVRPGDVLEIEMWSQKGREEVLFRAKVAGKTVLDEGVAVLQPSKSNAVEKGRL